MLRLSPSHLDAIRGHGEETYPHECCGFLLGQVVGGTKEVVEVYPARNERDDSARNRYLISPQAYFHAEQRAERRGLEILGFYHSHPDASARPSEFDRSHALPGCSYLIVAVEGGEAREHGAWVLGDDHAHLEQEEIDSPTPGRETAKER